MALDTDITMVNVTKSLTCLFRGVSQRPKKSQPAIPIPLIDTTPANTLLFRFFGQTEVIAFSFVVTDDGVDISSGTHTSTVITVAQQMQYLKDTFFSDGFLDTWTLTESEAFPSAITGVILDIEWDQAAGRPSIRTGTMIFHRGRIIDPTSL